jgi:hypothetical protein
MTNNYLYVKISRARKTEPGESGTNKNPILLALILFTHFGSVFGAEISKIKAGLCVLL